MRIIEYSVGNATVMDLRGNLAGWDANSLLNTVVDRFARGPGQELILNLRDVGRIDAVGLATLVSALGTVRRNGGTLKLMHLTTRMHDLVVIARLVTLFETVDLVDGAFRGVPAATILSRLPQTRVSVGLVRRLVARA